MTCLESCPVKLVRPMLARMRDDWGMSEADIGAELDVARATVGHIIRRRSSDIPAWLGHRILDLYETMKADPPVPLPVEPLARFLAERHQSPSDAFGGLAYVYHRGRDRGRLGPYDADRLAVALGHTPHTIWGADYDQEAA